MLNKAYWVAAMPVLVVFLVSCTSGPGAFTNQRVHRSGHSVTSGERKLVGFSVSLNPDCTVIGVPVVALEKAPSHGVVSIVKEENHPYFPQGNSRYDCNKQQTEGTAAYYTSQPGYVGNDAFTIKITEPDGRADVYTENVAVEPAPEKHDSPSADAEAKLKQLKSMRDQGLLTEDEYQAKRKAILDSM